MSKPCPDCGFSYCYRGYWTIECANPFCARVTVATMKDYRDQVVVRNNGSLTINWMKAAKERGYEAPELAPALREQQEKMKRMEEEIHRQFLDQMNRLSFAQPFFYSGPAPSTPPPTPKPANSP